MCKALQICDRSTFPSFQSSFLLSVLTCLGGPAGLLPEGTANDPFALAEFGTYCEYGETLNVDDGMGEGGKGELELELDACISGVDGSGTPAALSALPCRWLVYD